MKTKLIAFVILTTLSLCSLADDFTHIRCGMLLDVENKKVLAGHDILVKGSRIEAIGAGISVPEDARRIDLREQVCMPGLMDMHVHLFIDSTRGTLDALAPTQSSAENALMGLKKLQNLLQQGFTTIRIPGDIDYYYATVDLKHAIERGDFSGPRMFVAPHAISATGGHGDFNSYSADLPNPLTGPLVVNGVDAIRTAVRKEIKYGADWIKVMVSGGVMSQNSDPTVSAYSEAELKAFVEETHRNNKKITAHAHGDAGIRAAVEAGFDSIEHGTLMEKSTVKLMAEKGTVYVPTLYVLDWILERGRSTGISANNLEKALLVNKKHSQSVMLAYKHGVKMALGSDPMYPIEQAVREFQAMNSRLNDPWYVLQAGTINAAELLGLKAELGSLTTGKEADIVATPQSPIVDMKHIEQVNFVMKGGRIIHQP